MTRRAARTQIAFDALYSADPYSRINVHGPERITARGGAFVVAWGIATVIARDTAHVVARGQSTVIAYDTAHVEARDQSKVVATQLVAVHIHSIHAAVQGGVQIWSGPFRAFVESIEEEELQCQSS